MDYDIVLIDTDSIEGFSIFKLEESFKNYFVTSFDAYSLKKGLEILSELKTVVSLTKVLFAEEMLKEEKLEDISPFAYEITYIEDNKILGSLKYSLIYDRMEIDNILVEPSHRGKGIGNKLMSYLISVAIENRVDNITLEVRVSNDIARNLYKFNEVALRKYYYGDEDAILMEKQVM